LDEAGKVGAIVALAIGLDISASPAVAFQKEYSPYVGQTYPANVYWGDTHLHTSRSADAYIMGNRIDPDDAYRFARGETVIANNGMSARLRRPLDFIVVADHAEWLGVATAFEQNDSALLKSAAGRELAEYFKKNVGKSPTDVGSLRNMMVVYRKLSDKKGASFSEDSSFKRSVWQQVTALADRYNEPRRFTAFSGFEWTSWGTLPEGNLHRVVIFQDAADRVNRVLPFSPQQSSNPEDLWAYLDGYESNTGGKVLAIPHNGNLSGGEMFPLDDFKGRPLTRSYAERRIRWEPLYEVTQIKGTSESHPFLSSSDEFADFEVWNSWHGKVLPEGKTWNEEERRIKEGEYARAALKRGLALQAKLEINPFKFGLIGSSDAHTSLSAVDENNFWGKAPVTNPGPERSAADKITMSLPRSLVRELTNSSDPNYPPGRAWHMGASGYAAVWARENTREAIFEAMRRKETYASTGPRMTVRFFGGWDYAPADASKPDLALIGYRKGVPMGGDLTHAPAGKVPRFLIHAVKDPDGANLDRVQVIKGWLDGEGEAQEKVYNVALADGRETDRDGKAQPVGNTVDVANATYTNTIGDVELATVWTDPDFDPSALAFYYVRVIEIPTPRWTAYDAKFFGLKDPPPEIPMVTQERAYTSPIWYSPSPKT
jgi:hypothetical protein